MKASLYVESRTQFLQPVSVSIQHEAGEGAVLVVVAAVRLPSVQLDVNLIPGFQVEDDAVAGIVVVLIRVLCDGASSHLKREDFY